MAPAMDTLLILFLTLLNGAFAMSEMSLAASRKARLAAMACGGDEAHWCQPLPADATFMPQSVQQAQLAERYARFVALYPALQSQF